MLGNFDGPPQLGTELVKMGRVVAGKGLGTPEVISCSSEDEQPVATGGDRKQRTGGVVEQSSALVDGLVQ